MKRYRKTALAVLVVFILGTGTLLRSLAQEKPAKSPNVAITTMPPTYEHNAALDSQEKPKDIAVKPATVDVPFSASDAVEINKLRAVSEEASAKMWAIINTYGESGEVLVDAHKNYIGVRKAAETKKP